MSYSVGLSPDDPLLHVALDRKLLEIVAGYLGMWPCLNSVGVWLNYPDVMARVLPLESWICTGRMAARAPVFHACGQARILMEFQRVSATNRPRDSGARLDRGCCSAQP